MKYVKGKMLQQGARAVLAVVVLAGFGAAAQASAPAVLPSGNEQTKQTESTGTPTKLACHSKWHRPSHLICKPPKTTGVRG